MNISEFLSALDVVCAAKGIKRTDLSQVTVSKRQVVAIYNGKVVRLPLPQSVVNQLRTRVRNG